MVRRALFAGLLALAACGGSPGSDLHLALLVQTAAPVDSYAIRVFGAAVKCSEVMAAPASYELPGSATCAPAAVDTATDCLVAYDIFSASGSANRVSDIPAGPRTVFVEALSGSSVVGRGCAAVQVKAGETADVSLTVQ